MSAKFRILNNFVSVTAIKKLHGHLISEKGLKNVYTIIKLLGN